MTSPKITFALVVVACLGLDGRLFADQARANQAETKRLALYEAAQQISAPEFVGRDTDKDIETLAKLPALREHIQQLEQEYAVDIRTGNQPYLNVDGTIRYARERIEKFETALAEYAGIDKIKEDVEYTRKMLKLAIQNTAPAYFSDGNDISNRRRQIQTRLRILTLIASKEELAKAKEVSEKLSAEVLSAQQSLAKEIIRINELPIDNYQHSDRPSLLKLVETTWLKAEPKRRPLASGLIGDNWSRSEKWEIQNRSLYKVDQSQLQGFVVVGFDSNTHAVYHVQIRRDHTDNDRTTAWVINDTSLPPEPRELILASKLKR
jgi:hypothetical protein